MRGQQSPVPGGAIRQERGFDADVVVVGLGPVGALAAILLGQRGHRVVVVERWPQRYARPRAVTYDHEIARILAQLGIDSDNDDAVEFFDQLYIWRNAAGETLLEVDWASMSSSGWRVRYWFSQPELEARLEKVLALLPNVEVRRGWRATGVQQDSEGVVVAGETAGPGGNLAAQSVRARYLIGCDGANSFVREALGLTTIDLGYFFDWLILDVIPAAPMEISPPHWQLCDPARPTTIVPGGPGRRRWEFMALPGESIDELNREETAWHLLESWGVTPDTAELERHAVYRFQARYAQEWRQGRGLIAGDAAHLMPPFAGEGMCAGLRDAFALAWRLDLILRGEADDQLLDSYGSERSKHVQHYINFSVELGKVICVPTAGDAAERDQRMIEALAHPERTPVATDIATLGPGIWCEGEPHAGELSVQGRVEHNGHTGRLDEVIGVGWMVLGDARSPREALTPVQLVQWHRLRGLTVTIGSAAESQPVIDLDGSYRDWFERLGVSYLIIRPDFYVAAAAVDESSLRASFDRIVESLCLRAAADVAILWFRISLIYSNMCRTVFAAVVPASSDGHMSRPQKTWGRRHERSYECQFSSSRSFPRWTLTCSP
jgi:resorcinol 4-hydroxylase (NADPH)